MGIIKIPTEAYKGLCEHRRYTFEQCKDAIVKEEKDMVLGKDKDDKDIIGDGYYVDDEHAAFPQSAGAGTEMKKLLSMIGIKATPNCSCNRKAQAMDDEGIKWCEENEDKILDWLQEESKRRKLPFVRFAAKQMLKIAIRRAKANPRSKP
jgi:hypothetical protein